MVRAAFAALAHEVAKSTGIERTPEELAHGCLAIANDNMANAIKEISVQRGIDVTKGYALCCFGGAGSQHACQVADLLGIGRVFIHPYASVLSAYGMGLADLRVLRQQAIEKPLDQALVAELDGSRRASAEAVRAELRAQEVEDARIDARAAGPCPLRRHRHLARGAAGRCRRDARRLRGRAPDPLRLRRRGPRPRGRGGDGRGHRRHGGDRRAGAAACRRARRTRWSRCSPRRSSPPARRTSRPSGSRPRSIRREALLPGDRIAGPALVCGATTTVVVEPGWALEVTPRDHLILDRVEPLARAVAVGTHCDPILLEIFNNLFMTIAEQMGVTLQSTAYSVNVKERLDFSCAVFAADGALVANAPHMPVHLGSMGQSVRTILELNRDRLRPGDVWALNNPYNGGTHLPDITVVMPVFEGDELVFFTAVARASRRCRRHHPGLDAARQHDHRRRRACCSTISSWSRTASCARRRCWRCCAPGHGPVRNVTQNVADLQAQVASCQRGANELAKMVAQFGLATVRAYMGHVQDNAEESVRRVLDVLQDGEFTYAHDAGPVVQVKISIDKEARRAKVDFTGTSAQQPWNFNAPAAVTRAAVLYVFRTLVDDDIPMNEGCLKPIDIVLPEGSIVCCRYPAAVCAGNVETSQWVTDTLYGALGRAGRRAGDHEQLHLRQRHATSITRPSAAAAAPAPTSTAPRACTPT